MAKSSGSLNSKVSMSVSTLVLFALIFGAVGGYAIFKSFAAPANKSEIAYFSISGQSPGTIKLGAGTNQSPPPSNLTVTATCYDYNGVQQDQQSAPLGSWISNPPGYFATVSFNDRSGLYCAAHIYKSGSTKVLATVSYLSP